jgi:PAS domain S-box-containing protein
VADQSPQPQATAIDKLCLEALQALGKTLGQMSLYKIGHPAVAATLKIAEEHLTKVLGQVSNGELLYSFDAEKLVANGRIVGNVGQLPSSVAGVFTRFKLASLTFKAGLTNAELAAFCELAAMRADAAAAKDPEAYLKEKNVTHIVFSEAVYAKMSEEALIQAIEQRSLDDIVQALIGNALSDPKAQRKALEKVTQLVQQDIQRRVDEVVKPLQQERNVLANDQARTNTVLSNMVEGVVVVDEAGKILMMNPVAEQIYGTTLAQAAGTHLIEKAGQEHVVTLAAEIATPVDRDINKDVKVSGGEEVKNTLKSASAVVQNEQGKVVGLVSTLSDAAKYKEVQRMQRDFVAHVTHELRAPLSSIRAALEILQGEVAAKLQEDENKMLATAMKNSDRLADLINSILDFSKIESGQMQVFPKKCDAEKIARDGVDSLAAWASKKKVNLSLVTAPELPPVTADAQRTVQVLINLLSNAIKFTPGGGAITVRLSLGADERGMAGQKSVEFSVTDTGPGIDKTDQKKIFEKFVQIASGEMHVGGTGLGLAIAKALVHLQGGKMWVQSEPGKGAIFFFTVPVYVSKDGTTTTGKPAAELPWWKSLLGLKK